jgi:hypothetical protein
VFNYGSHYNLVTILFFLTVGHAACDFPLQGPYLSVAKDPNSPEGQKGIWRWALFYHSIIHAGAVVIFTHSILLGVFECVCHFSIDSMKNNKVIGFNTDQFLHVLCKVVWAALAAYGIA